MKLASWWEDELDKEALSEPEDDKGTEAHAWYAPFHKAITSGLVDGGAAIQERRTDDGNVSEYPPS